MRWFIFLLLAVTPYAMAEPTVKVKKVISVYDGDTFTVESGERIRIKGIDAPERYTKHGPASTEYLEVLISNKDVELHCDGKSYKRIVCLVYVDGVDVQKEMVKAGWAWDWPKYSGGAYQEEQCHAYQNKKGIWGDW